MAIEPAIASKSENVLFLPGIFNETLRLLLQAHDYFYHYGQADQEKLTGRERSLYACEMSRITLRLSCVMAWLMVRKAVSVGKISDEEALDKYELDSTDICLFENVEALPYLPSYVSKLLHQSFQIYERIWRLDKLLRQKQEITPNIPYEPF